MSATPVVIAAWARSAVAPVGGALAALHPHELAAPVVQALLARAGVSPQAVDAVLVGNALGAGGNPARMVSLAAGLPERCSALSVDTQCCSGLDAVRLGAALIASGQASVVVAGGVEAWSRAPLRATRPRQADESPQAYERPPFAPRPEQDPDLLLSAARYAAAHGHTRAAQDAYAVLSHQRALAHASAIGLEIVPVAGLTHDAYPRPVTPERAARMPVAAQADVPRGPAADAGANGHISRLAISAKADGAAFVLLLSAAAAQAMGVPPQAQWLAGVATGGAPDTPLLAAQAAALAVMRQAHIASSDQLHAIELHDAFAVQGLCFAQALGLAPERLNPDGGGLARGHPIGASGAVALVRLLAHLAHHGQAGAQGLVAVAGAGGLGSAAVVVRC